MKNKGLKVIILFLIINFIAFNLFQISIIPDFYYSFFGMLGVFTMFYLLRYIFEDEYRKRTGTKIGVDIILTTLAFSVLQYLIDYFRLFLG